MKKYKTEKIVHTFKKASGFYEGDIDAVEVAQTRPDEVVYRWIVEGSKGNRRIDAFAFRSPELRALMKERREKDGYYYMPGVEARRIRALKNYLRRIYCVWRSGYMQSLEDNSR